MVLKIEVVKKYQEQCAPKMIWFNEKQKLERFGSFFTMQLSIKLGYKSKKKGILLHTLGIAQRICRNYGDLLRQSK